MTKHRSLLYNNPIPQDFLDAVQEFISTYMSPNMVLSILNATTIQLAAATDNGQVAVAINGRWRYNQSSVNGTFTSGAAGSYPIWATAADNSFVVGPPETDSTVYTFALAIQASTPATALVRQIGSIYWNGSAIVDANLLFDDPSTHGGLAPGDYILSGAPNRPGALLCDGSSILRTAQPALFNAIGTTYGSVDGTHFTLPDWRGRTFVGAGTGSGLTARTPGTTVNVGLGGEETHLLTAGESGTTAHTHASGGTVTGSTGVESQGHTHGVIGTDGTAGGTNTFPIQGSVAADFTVTSQGESQQHTHPAGTLTDPATPAASAASAASAHNNMQPWLAGYVFIKT